jgi:alkylhydroperoxidase/carboxymuconolactone decarboxylase family protein YurZ
MPDSFDKRAAHKALVEHIVEGQGTSTQALRRAAFDNKVLEAPLGTLIHKVAAQPTRIIDEDIGAVKAAGLSEDQVFELIICAAVGQSSRQYTSALDALRRARSEGGGKDAT